MTTLAHKEKILTIDDFVPILRVYEAAFGTCFEVTTASHLEDIKRLSGSENFRYVITDYNLPGVVFEDLVRYLRETYPEAKIILISGSHKIDELREQYKDDFEAVMEKPVDILSLRAMLQR